MKLGLLIYMDLLKRATSTSPIDTDILKGETSPNLKSDVKLRHSGRHLEIDITSYLPRGWTDLDEIRLHNIE